MLNKRGQYFIIAAIVIVGIVASLNTIYSQAEAPEENTRFQKLAEEINYEGTRTVESGILNGENKDSIQDSMLELLNYYEQNNPQIDYIAIYGIEEDIYLRTNEDSQITGQFNDQDVNIQSDQDRLTHLTKQPGDNTMRINLAQNVEKEISLNERAFFYAFLKQEQGGQRLISNL